jgi:4-amino-4-deoxy-L-arabinose transferase-like glycosyltransferase
MTTINETAELALPQTVYVPDTTGAAVVRAARAVPWAICAITALAAALRLAELDDVAGNPFYDAAVRTMSASFHNFFFGAFDPRAVLAVDKPPLSLWLQVASTQLFGWSSVSLKLPEVVAGTLAVPLLYDAARRVVGRPAGLAAAAVLAVLPVSVLTSRSDTMDSLTMLFVVAALWLAVRATTQGSRRWLLVVGVAFGLAFNVKLFEGLLAAPAVMLLYLLAAQLPWRRRLADVAAACGVLVAVSLSWAVLATLAPGSHPFVIGSADGTVFNAMFVFDGFGRAVGAMTAGGTYAAPPGLSRLFAGGPGNLAALFGAVLVAALALGLAAVAAGAGPGGTAPEPDREQRLRLAFWVVVAAWLGIGFAVFSHVTVMHARYLEAVTPPVALTLGGAVASLLGFGKRAGVVSAPAVALLAAALACVCWYVSLFAPTAVVLLTVVFAVAAVGAASLATVSLYVPRFARPARVAAALLALACCLAYPIHISLELVRSASTDSSGLPVWPTPLQVALARYLGPRTVGARYELASDNAIELAPLMIARGTPVLPLTSFGAQPLVGVDRLRGLIHAGAVRYALVGNHPCASVGDGAACLPASLWVRENGIDVSAAAGLPHGLRLSLYLLPDT